MSNVEISEKSVGALWAKKTTGGEPFYSGQLELEEGNKINIVVFKNKQKKESKHPDLRIFLARPKDAPQATPTPTDDDIPFN